MRRYRKVLRRRDAQPGSYHALPNEKTTRRDQAEASNTGSCYRFLVEFLNKSSHCHHGVWLYRRRVLHADADP
jgi:hypothetical protein